MGVRYNWREPIFEPGASPVRNDPSTPLNVSATFAAAKVGIDEGLDNTHRSALSLFLNFSTP